jgi:hypothetical protein
MKKILLFIVGCAVFSSCTVYLGDAPPPKKTDEEIVDEMCKQGDKQACVLVDQIQQKKEEKYQKIIKESGLRSK